MCISNKNLHRLEEKILRKFMQKNYLKIYGTWLGLFAVTVGILFAHVWNKNSSILETLNSNSTKEFTAPKRQVHEMKEGEKRKEETERKGRLEGASQCPSSYRKPASQEASFTGSLGALEAPVVGSWEPLGWRGCVGPC